MNIHQFCAKFAKKINIIKLRGIAVTLDTQSVNVWWKYNKGVSSKMYENTQKMQ